MINNIVFYNNFIDIVINNSNRFKVSNKCLRYAFSLKKLIGIHIFDLVSIDSILKENISNKSVCLELSIIFLKCATIYNGLELFSYISDEYYLPYVVIKVSDKYVVCNDYCYIESFLSYLNRCFWNIDISDIELLFSKYNLSFLDHLDYININDYFTITDIFDEIDLGDFSMISGSDIVFDLAVSLGIKYVLIDKKTNYKRLFDIVKYLDVC